MKINYLIIFSALLLSFASCKKGKNNHESCNGSSTRRDVKILVDDLARAIDTTPQVISVSAIGSLDVPEAKRKTERQSIEQKVFTITAKVDKLSKHRDGDWKIKLSDGNDKYINCEAPNMGCEYIKNALYFDEMSQVRTWIEANQNDLEGKTVTITGVAFIDIDHKFPRKAADNELELHPILKISF